MKKHFYYNYTNRHALNSDYIPVMANCQNRKERSKVSLSFVPISVEYTFSFNYVHMMSTSRYNTTTPFVTNSISRYFLFT